MINNLSKIKIVENFLNLIKNIKKKKKNPTASEILNDEKLDVFSVKIKNKAMIPTLATPS